MQVKITCIFIVFIYVSMSIFGISMKRSLLLVLGYLLSVNVSTADELNFIDAIKQGEAGLSFRARYEDVRATNTDAQAFTLRSRLTFETKRYNLFSALIEFDDITAIPDDENYYTGENGQSDDAVVQDAEGTELNRVWLGYDIANTKIKYGRQNVSFDNERFFGKDAWRQNAQSFTGLSVFNESLNYLRINLAQLNQVEGVEGESSSTGKRDLSAQLINVEYRGFLNSKLALYSYWLDSDYIDNQEDTVTYGVRYSGRIKNSPEIDYALEYAMQNDSDGNALNYSAAYTLVDFGIMYNNVRLGLGQEVLEADGLGYFITPLASLHDFQGWTDQFQNQGLGNIAGGVQDRYFSLGYSCLEFFQIKGVYHQFKSESRSAGLGDLGTEWGLEFEGEINEYSFNMKYAEYKRNDFGEDTEKFWLSVGARF
jgi:hypothetical protein